MTLTILVRPSSAISRGSCKQRALQPDTTNATEATAAKEYQESKRWADFGARRLLGQLSMQVQRRMTTTSRCRPSSQTHPWRGHHCCPVPRHIPSAQARDEIERRLYRHKTGGKIMTLKPNTSSNSILRSHHPYLWSASQPAVPHRLSSLSPHGQCQTPERA